MRRLREKRKAAKARTTLKQLKEASARGCFSDSESSGAEDTWTLRRHVRSIRKMKLLSRVRDLPLQLCLPDFSNARNGHVPFEPMVMLDGAAIERIVSLAAWAGYECCCRDLCVHGPRNECTATSGSGGGGGSGSSGSYAPLAEGGAASGNGHIAAVDEVGVGVLCHLLYRHHAVSNAHGEPTDARAAAGLANGPRADDGESTDDSDLLFHDAEEDEESCATAAETEDANATPPLLRAHSEDGAEAAAEGDLLEEADDGEASELHFQDAVEKELSPRPSASTHKSSSSHFWSRKREAAASASPARAWRVTFVVQGRPYAVEVLDRAVAPVCCLLAEVLRAAKTPEGHSLSWNPAGVSLVDVATGAVVLFTGELSRPLAGQSAVVKVVLSPTASSQGVRASLLEADEENAMPQDVYDSLPEELKRSLAERRERQRQQQQQHRRRSSAGTGTGGRYVDASALDEDDGDAGSDFGDVEAASVAEERQPLPPRPRGGPERFNCPATCIPPLSFVVEASAEAGSASGSSGGGPRNCWEEPEAATFKVRGLNYMADGRKVPSEEAAYLLLGIDLLVSDEPHHEVGARENGFVQRFRRQSGDKCPFMLVLNFCLPWGSFIAYLSPRHGGASPYVGDPKFDGLLRRVFEGVGAGDDSGSGGSASGDSDGEAQRAEAEKEKEKGGDPDYFPNNRLKIVPRCHAGPWLVRQTVGGKPAIIGNKIKQVYHTGEGYFEIETDINSSMAALYILAVVKNFTEAVAVDLGFVIQGETTEELPERLIGALRFHHLDVANAIDFDAWEARPDDT